MLAQNAMLRRIVELVDEGTAVGNADIPALRRLLPGLLTLDDWLAGGGAAAVRALFAT